jgi:hypothetical protein
VSAVFEVLCTALLQDISWDVAGVIIVGVGFSRGLSRIVVVLTCGLFCLLQGGLPLLVSSSTPLPSMDLGLLCRVVCNMILHYMKGGASHSHVNASVALSAKSSVDKVTCLAEFFLIKMLKKSLQAEEDRQKNAHLSRETVFSSLYRVLNVIVVFKHRLNRSAKFEKFEFFIIKKAYVRLLQGNAGYLSHNNAQRTPGTMSALSDRVCARASGTKFEEKVF